MRNARPSAIRSFSSWPISRAQAIPAVRLTAKDEAGCVKPRPALGLPLVERVLEDGVVVDTASGLIAAPLYVHGAIQGVLAVAAAEQQREC